ncbi:MAG: hypothetical protein ACHQWU_10235 [Gemmatimonadales bacterium]
MRTALERWASALGKLAVALVAALVLTMASYLIADRPSFDAVVKVGMSAFAVTLLRQLLLVFAGMASDYETPDRVIEVGWSNGVSGGRVQRASYSRKATIAVVAIVIVMLPVEVREVRAWFDLYQGWSGTVVRKGYDWGGTPTPNLEYLVVRDSQGVERKRYVGPLAFALALPGSFVQKKQGFGSRPIRSDEPEMWRLRDSIMRRP